MIEWTEVLNTAFAIFITVGAGFFAYMSSHLVSEKKAGHRIPLPWEKE